MVRALLAGTKTQTRRVVKPSAVKTIEFMGGRCDGKPMTREDFDLRWQESYVEDGDSRKKYPAQWCVSCSEYPEEGVVPIGTAYGVPGDRLWVKESIRRLGEPSGEERWCASEYIADGVRTSADCWPWKNRALPSMHMPKGLSRITLEVTGVRVERLQDISETDAKAEGLIRARGPLGSAMWEYSETTGGQFADARVAYRMLWEHINGPGSWDANPWVWVVEFKRLPA